MKRLRKIGPAWWLGVVGAVLVGGAVLYGQTADVHVTSTASTSSLPPASIPANLQHVNVPEVNVSGPVPDPVSSSTAASSTVQAPAAQAPAASTSTQAPETVDVVSPSYLAGSGCYTLSLGVSFPGSGTLNVAADGGGADSIPFMAGNVQDVAVMPAQGGSATADDNVTVTNATSLSICMLPAPEVGGITFTVTGSIQ